MVDDHNIQGEVKKFVDKTLENIKIHKDSVEKRIESICEAMKIITQEYTTEDYRFNLAMDVFVEGAYKDLSECLEKILDDTNLESENSDVIFAVYYALSLSRKKAKDLEGLKMLLDDKYKPLSKYPLYYEVFSRYYKRVDRFTEALAWDKRVINILATKNIVNVAVYISYASTVCLMMENKVKTLRDHEVELSRKYIDAAIEYNPEYGKYYFVKARFQFLTVLRNKGDVEALEEAALESHDYIEDIAKIKDWKSYKDQNVFLKVNSEEYDKFKVFMVNVIEKVRHPRFAKSDDELDELKMKIFASDSQDKCASSSLTPPLPVFREKDKYFFICYSSTDFKSVYSDLIELYKRKVPFKYDERLTHGVGWQAQIAEGIGNKNCAGVVFYLSRDMISRDSIYDEIRITTEYEKDYFCVNLEGNTLPSRMLVEWIADQYNKDEAKHVKGEQMRSFLNFFYDNQVFAQKFKEDGPDGTNHIDSYVDALKRRFPDLIYGD